MYDPFNTLLIHQCRFFACYII